MRSQLSLILLLVPFLILSQDNNSWKKSSLVFTPEILLGKTAESNDGFPDTELQKQIVLSFGRDHTNNPKEWADGLKGLKTGVSLGITDFGNLDRLGLAISAIPYAEFNIFKQKRLSALLGFGLSYFTKKYDSIENPANQAVTTDLTMSFRGFINYHFLTTDQINWRVGVGVAHHSNGHTKLLNQGYNSALFSVSADISNRKRTTEEIIQNSTSSFSKSSYSYFRFSGGLGKNVLALPFNDKKNVYTLSGVYGRVWNNRYKLGLGIYYRFYQHYYDYIKGNESLVNDGREFAHFKENPRWYASNIALTINGEYLLNHIGIDFQIGFNLHKPAYKIDWRINQGWDNTPREISETWMLGEYNTKYQLKQLISTRLGLKYYLIGTIKKPKHNLYLGCYINANLGQADFAELSLGYVYAFDFK